MLLFAVVTASKILHNAYLRRLSPWWQPLQQILTHLLDRQYAQPLLQIPRQSCSRSCVTFGLHIALASICQYQKTVHERRLSKRCFLHMAKSCFEHMWETSFVEYPTKSNAGEETMNIQGWGKNVLNINLLAYLLHTNLLACSTSPLKAFS